MPTVVTWPGSWSIAKPIKPPTMAPVSAASHTCVWSARADVDAMVEASAMAAVNAIPPTMPCLQLRFIVVLRSPAPACAPASSPIEIMRRVANPIVRGPEFSINQ